VKHFLIKPFTAEALLTMMHKVLTEPLPSRGTRPMM
jgi:YesN/AraC family two-component response regulator